MRPGAFLCRRCPRACGRGYAACGQKSSKFLPLRARLRRDARVRYARIFLRSRKKLPKTAIWSATLEKSVVALFLGENCGIILRDPLGVRYNYAMVRRTD